MASMQSLGASSPGQSCVLILIFTVLLQSLCVAMTYIYFTNELKQVSRRQSQQLSAFLLLSLFLHLFPLFENFIWKKMLAFCLQILTADAHIPKDFMKMQDKYFKSVIACFLKEDDSLGDPINDDAMDSPCWQVKWQLRQLVRKMISRTNEETIPAVQETQLSIIPSREREGRPERVAAHVTGNSRRSSAFSIPGSKSDKALGQKIKSWESSRKGHSLLNNFHLKNGELVVHQTGLYYIYSQTYFRFQEVEETSAVISKENKKKSKQLVQYIYKCTDYPDPIMLMKSARNSCWSKDSEYGLYSIYQGGMFELKENDRIFVSVTNEHLIDLDQEASFFGAFLIN